MSTERDHLDAETVAAWLDGGLDAVSLAAAEAHASTCERCQALLATAAKTLPIDDAPGLSAGISSWWKWWMAPLAATAAAVTLWMVVPQEQVRQISTRTPQAEADAPTADARARDAAPTAPAIEPLPTQPPQPQPAKEQFDEVNRRADAPAATSQESQFAQQKPGAAAANLADAAAARDRQNAKSEEARLARAEAEPARAPAPAAPAAAAPAEIGAMQERAAVTQLRKQVAPVEFLSPDPQRRWRVTSNGIERSEDGGGTWMLVRLAQGETITAGASPAPLVLWLVGRRGLVLLATDGTNFTQLPFPEAVDLTAVSSPELRTAVVTTVDGRIFRTENAGRTWNRQ